MPGVIAHTRQPLDHLCHAGQGPEVRAEAEGEGAVPQGRLDGGQLRLAEFRFPPCPPGSPQRCAAASRPLPAPAHHALATDAEVARNGRVGLGASGEEAGGGEPPLLHAMEIPSRSHMCLHAPMVHYAAENVTLLCETQ